MTDKENVQDPAEILTKHIAGTEKKKAKSKKASKVDTSTTETTEEQVVENKETTENTTPKGKFNVEFNYNINTKLKEPMEAPLIDDYPYKFGNAQARSNMSKDDVERLLMINMPSKNNVSESNALDDDTPASEITDKQASWTIRVGDSSYLNANSNDIHPELYSEKALNERKEWGQYLVSPSGDKLALNSTSLDFRATGPIKGSAAVSKVRAMLGLGNLIKVPLWHSGFWVMLNTPTEAEVADLFRAINTDKIQLGYATHGLAFSNLSGITSDNIVDFVLRHIEMHSIKDVANNDIDKLKETILVQDINLLVWGIVCTMYPRGFQYTRQCMNIPSCHEVISEILDVRRLLFTDRTALTPEQLTHMSKARARSSVTMDEVKKYQKSIDRLHTSKVKIVEGAINNKGNCDMYVVLKSPNLQEYINATNAWVDNVQALAENTAGLKTENEKLEYIETRARATKARQYAHWVESIIYDNKLDDDDEKYETTIEETEDIATILGEVVSMKSEYIDALIDKVVDYINHTTISIIGIPTYYCPKCNEVQEVDNKLPRFVNFIPLDVISLFFRLLVQRMFLINTR